MNKGFTRLGEGIGDLCCVVPCELLPSSMNPGVKLGVSRKFKRKGTPSRMGDCQCFGVVRRQICVMSALEMERGD